MSEPSKLSGTSTIIDFSFSCQKSSKILLGITIILASFYESSHTEKDPSSYCSCMNLSISRAEGPAGTCKFRKTVGS
jgi:hypothetical protein